jgi:hypothetical protein
LFSSAVEKLSYGDVEKVLPIVAVGNNARFIKVAAALDDKGQRGSGRASSNANAEPVPIVPNGVPIDQARRITPKEEGDFFEAIPLASGDQPLWAPPSFGTLPPPLTQAELEHMWLRPDPADLQADAWRAASPTRFAELTADFDGDGKPDRAQLRVGPGGWKEGLFVQFSSHLPDMWQPLLSVVHDQQSPRLVMGIQLVSPGSYLTACGKGHGRCGVDEPREVTLQYPGIRYFQYETSASLVFWDEPRRQLRRVWTAD